MTKHALGDQPIEKEFELLMKGLATVIDETFNGNAKGSDRKVGFLLMVYAFGDTGRTNYISNTERADVIALLREQLARFERLAKP